jgi:hypothetical protein
VLVAYAGASIPDGFGLAVFGATLWALVYLYIRLCRRFPIAGWIGLGFLAGVFGWERPVYIRNEVTVDDEGNEVAAVTDDTYCDSGASSDSRED